MYNDFYRGKRVLVTGVAGVKGSWLALALLRAGAQVVGVDNGKVDRYSNFSAAGLERRIEFVSGDVADPALMQSLVNRVDCVFHLAAMAIVRDANRHPFEAYRSNTLGVVAILEAIRDAARPVRAVFVTTDKVYRPKNGEPWVETDPLVASGPYAVSKACAEIIIADYQRCHFQASGVLIGVGRAGNVVIGGDLHSSRRTNGGGRIFVDCFEALAEGRAPEIYSPNFTRPYTYGLDILSGYMSLMSQLDAPGVAGQAFNFGPREEYGVPNSVLAGKICEIWGSGITWRSGTPREEPFEFQSLCIRKSDQVLGWRPAFALDEALRGTADWYRAWVGKGDSPEPCCMCDVNDRLLETYENTARRLGIRWAAPAETPSGIAAESSAPELRV